MLLLLLLLLFRFFTLSVLSTCVRVINSHHKSRNQNSSEIDHLCCQDVQLSRAFNQGQDGGCQGGSLRRQQDEWKADRARAGHSQYSELLSLPPNVLNDKMLQIVLTKPSAAAAAGSFLDIMRHPTLRIHTLIM